MMSKLITNPITQSDIREYLINYSDFSFELLVLKKFVDLGLECSHGGTYEDPVTSKSRQFDIRALLQEDYVRIHLSIECKNIRENFPLIVHCLKRTASESYNELIDTHKPEDQKEVQRAGSISVSLPIFREHSRSIRVTQLSLYQKGYYVAKSADQIGRRQNDSEITSFDGEVFDKISQAINSAVDLISEAHYLDTSKSPFYFTFVCPVLIVPDMSLWQVKYADDGAQIEEPEQIEHISYYIGKDWTVGDKIHSLNYTLSHLEIVTYSGIKNFVEKYLYGLMKRCFTVVRRGTEFS